MFVVVLQVHDVRKEFGGHTVLGGVSFHLTEGERVGLVGPNGSGKSTLLQILTGDLEADGGQVSWIQPRMRRAYVPQEPPWVPHLPLGEQIGPVPGGLLARWGLDPSVLHRPAGSLSGGQKTRASLASALGSDPQVLLLDEPTNHLDTGGLEWLERTLQAYPGTVLVVSHDRFFLDRVVGRVLSLDGGQVRSYSGDYSAYAEQRRQEQERADAEYRRYVKEKRRLEEAIRRQMEWARRAQEQKNLPRELAMAKPSLRAKAKTHVRRAKAMEKRLERIRVERPERPNQINLGFGGGGGGGRTLIAAEELGFTYDGERWLFRKATFAVPRGERVLVLGPNGSGKTTLLKLLLGEMEPNEGRIHRAPARTALLAQELENLDLNRTVLAEASGGSAARDEAEVRTILGCLLLGGETVMKRVGDLSGGEKVRLGLAKILLEGPDMLVLDEPTNGLDLPSRERVEEALEGFAGTLLLVSHDRYLLRRLGSQVLALDRGRIVSFPGGYQAFEEHHAARARQQAAGADTATHCLLLEHRMAELAGLLANPPEGEAGQLQEEYLRLARELRALTGRSAPEASSRQG